MSSSSDTKTELDEGAVLVVSGQHANRVGFYCLQNEQTFDMREIEACQRCKVSKGVLTKVETNLSERESVFESPIEIETGSYCEKHRQALIAGEMAVVYWDRPYGIDYALAHPTALVQIPSIVYARYVKDCQRDVGDALSCLLTSLTGKE